MDVGSGTDTWVTLLIGPKSHSLCPLTPWICAVSFRSSPKWEGRACFHKPSLPQHNRTPLFSLTTREGERIRNAVTFWGAWSRMGMRDTMHKTTALFSQGQLSFSRHTTTTMHWLLQIRGAVTANNSPAFFCTNRYSGQETMTVLLRPTTPWSG